MTEPLLREPEQIRQDCAAKFRPEMSGGGSVEIVSGWKQASVGTFYIFRYLTKYTIFLDDRRPSRGALSR
jgi:hypothetical protein